MHAPNFIGFKKSPDGPNRKTKRPSLAVASLHVAKPLGLGRGRLANMVLFHLAIKRWARNPQNRRNPRHLAVFRNHRLGPTHPIQHISADLGVYPASHAIRMSRVTGIRSNVRAILSRHLGPRASASS